MKCIAIDDEPIALRILEEYASRMGNIELTTFTNPIIGLEEVKRTLPDLLFLDIEMKGINGLELARMIPAGTHLIFTTAYAQYALEGFELNAVDYLHKPFSFARFETAISKVSYLQSLKQQARSADEPVLLVKAEYKNIKIPCREILYIEAINNYVKIHRDQAHPVLTQISMKNILEMLPPEHFIRVHKSYIVAKQAIVRFTRNEIFLKDLEKSIPVGRTYADALTQVL